MTARYPSGSEFKIASPNFTAGEAVLTAGAGKVLLIQWVHVEWTSGAAVGNREIELQARDDSDVTYVDVHSPALQAASLTKHYEFLQGTYREASFSGTTISSIQLPMPTGLFLLPAYDLVVKDAAGISNLDTVITTIGYRELAR